MIAPGAAATGAGASGPTGFPPIGRCRVMGIVNVTPDSFSDGGSLPDVAAAVRHGLALRDAGADLVDIGGESTRPGADRVSRAEELRRVVPVVAGLVQAGVLVSLDTSKAAVAEAGLDAGAHLVNDVSGGLDDPDLLPLVAERGIPYVIMHGRGPSARMQDRAVYRDVVAEVRAELQQRVEAALQAGVRRELLVLDPGLGFAKLPEHNWTLLRRLDAFADLDLPLLIGASRKRFLGSLLADPDGGPRPVDRREDATTAISALVAAAGAFAVRVHEVRASADAVRVAAAVRAAGAGA